MKYIRNHLLKTVLLALVFGLALAPAEVDAQRSGKRTERTEKQTKRAPAKRTKGKAVKKQQDRTPRAKANTRTRSARSKARPATRNQDRRAPRTNKPRTRPQERTIDLNQQARTRDKDVRTRDDRRRGDNDRVRDGDRRRRGDNDRVRDTRRRGDDDRVRDGNRRRNDRVRDSRPNTRPKGNRGYDNRRDDRYRRGDRYNQDRRQHKQRDRFKKRYRYHSRNHRNQWHNRQHRYHYRYNWRRYNRNQYYRRWYHRQGRPVFGFYINIASYGQYHNDYYRGRTSRFMYRQRINAHGGYNSHNWDGQYDVRSTIRRKIKHVGHDRVEIEFQIERIDIYDGGYKLGSVGHIPGKLGRMKATLYQDGYVEFDRMTYLLGDPSRGFELVSTRYYGGNVLDAYERGHGFRVGVLDFRRGRVANVRHSEFFDPYNFTGFVPVALVPDDDYWGFQYLAGGSGAQDDYYYGNYDYYANDYADDDGYFYRSEDDGYANGAAYPSFKQDSSARNGAPYNNGRSFTNQGNMEYQTQRGADIRLERQVEIQHLGAE